MVSRDVGILNPVIPVPEKAPLPSSERWFPAIVTPVSWAQRAKAAVSMVSTLTGMVTDSSAVPMNAFSPM
ncbi:hypothetical protein SDC9_91969 [bioreactor metagenome]|uniref:Uncharacterized protein n=1 Tax=bioreactor metagenome TaxID=1076179 RepID=A0A645A350_9ZZZZ